MFSLLSKFNAHLDIFCCYDAKIGKQHKKYIVINKDIGSSLRASLFFYSGLSLLYLTIPYSCNHDYMHSKNFIINNNNHMLVPKIA